MGRKRKKPSVEEPPIFCYYCDRTFKSEAILVSHQREKHLRCPHCRKCLTSINGLTIHCSQVHKRTLQGVPNAIDGRQSLEVDVFGMEGIPPSFLQAYNNQSSNIEPSLKTMRTSQTGNQQSTPSYYNHQNPYYSHPYNQHYNYYHPGQYPNAVAPQYYPPTTAYAGGPAIQSHAHPSNYYSYPAQHHPHYASHNQPYSGQYYGQSNPSQRVQPQSTYAAPKKVEDSLPPVLKPVGEVGDGPRASAGGGVTQEDIVFKELNVSPEELRARLPRYATSAKQEEKADPPTA